MNKIEFETPTLKKIIKNETKKFEDEASKSHKNLEEAMDIISSLHGRIITADEYLYRLIMQKNINKSELLRLRNMLHGHEEKSVVSKNDCS